MNEAKQLSGLDTLFLYAESARTPLEVSSLHIYDPSTAPSGHVRFKDILAAFDRRLDQVDAFTRCLRHVPFSLDHPYWIEDEHFDLEHHVRHIALPAPGDWRQLMIQIARLQAYQLDHTRPLWEAYVIEGLNNIEGIEPGSFAVFIKMHHANVDGTTGIQIQRAIHDLEPRAPAPEADAPQRKPRRSTELPDDWTLLRRVPLNTFRKSIRLGLGLAAATPGLARAALASIGKPRPKVPRTMFNQRRASANRVVEARAFALAELKAIAAAVPGTTINDVVLAVVAGALRRYLQAKDALPADSLVAACPVNARATDGRHDTHDNMVSLMNTPLCTEREDPLERLRGIHSGTQEAKATIETVGARTLTEVPMHLPAPMSRNLLPLLSELAVRTGSFPFNTMVSNVAGIQQPLYLAGAEMKLMFGMGPVVDQLGLFHAAFSYNGQLSITVTACRETLPDPEFYAECLQAAEEELLAATAGDFPAGRQAAHRKAPGTEAGKRRQRSGATGKRGAIKKATRKKASAKRASKRQSAGKKSPAKKTSNRRAKRADR